MTKQEVANRIMEIGVVPVVRASSAKQAMLAAEAVRAGGISIVEVTMTVPSAIEVIAELSKNMGSEVLIGTGTVLDADTAQRCIDAGAEFVVSPGFDLETVRSVNRTGKLMMAGALTPSEVIAAWKAGSDFVKIFPCAQVGGDSYIKALKGPFPRVPLIAAGGVNQQTASAFILAGAAALGIGGELIPRAAIELRQPERIRELARRFLNLVKMARVQMSQWEASSRAHARS